MRAAAQPGQLKDAFARLGDGRGRLLLEGCADQVAIGGHLAHRTIEIPLPQAVQAPLPKRGTYRWTVARLTPTALAAC